MGVAAARSVVSRARKLSFSVPARSGCAEPAVPGRFVESDVLRAPLAACGPDDETATDIEAVSTEICRLPQGRETRVEAREKSVLAPPPEAD